jgi:hypothetical protein
MTRTEVMGASYRLRRVGCGLGASATVAVARAAAAAGPRLATARQAGRRSRRGGQGDWRGHSPPLSFAATRL